MTELDERMLGAVYGRGKREVYPVVDESGVMGGSRNTVPLSAGLGVMARGMFDRFAGDPLAAAARVGGGMLGRKTGATERDVLESLLLYSGPGLLRGMTRRLPGMTEVGAAGGASADQVVTKYGFGGLDFNELFKLSDKQHIEIAKKSLGDQVVTKVTTLNGERVVSPRRFYRGTVPWETERIRTGDVFWDGLLFVSDNLPSAQMYGPKIERFIAKPDARILYEGSKDYRSIAKGLSGKPINLLQYSSEVARRAKALGYDAVWFKRQGDVGTAILNESAFLREK